MYNTVNELHIALNLSLQYIKSNRKSVIKPYEIDWLLNETMFRTIDDIIDGKQIEGYDDTQLSYDALQPIKTRRKLDFDVDAANNKLVCVIPDNYLHHDSVEVHTVADCGVNRSLINNEGRYLVLPLIEDTVSPYYADLKIVIDSPLSTLYDAVTRGLTNINNEDSKFVYIADVITVLREANYSVYWEYYGGIYHPNSFIIFANFSTAPFNLTMTYHTVISHSTTNTIPLKYYETGAGTSVIHSSVDTRLISTNIVRNLLNHKYGTTNPKSPIMTIEDNKIMLYYNDDFYISEVYLTYIRKPKLINYIINQMPEVKNISNLIVQLTVQNIKAKIKDDNYNLITNENVLNKII